MMEEKKEKRIHEFTVRVPIELKEFLNQMSKKYGFKKREIIANLLLWFKENEQAFITYLMQKQTTQGTEKYGPEGAE